MNKKNKQMILPAQKYKMLVGTYSFLKKMFLLNNLVQETVVVIMFLAYPLIYPIELLCRRTVFVVNCKALCNDKIKAKMINLNLEKL